jgi:uncharacterized protein YggE
MKKSWTVATALALVLVLSTTLFLRAQQAAAPTAGSAKEKGTINTSGTATLTVKPDAVHVYFGVQTIGKQVKAAREDNSEKCKKLIAALNALGIADLKIKTADINVELVQSHPDEASKLPEILGYRVTNSFSVLVQDKDAAKLSQNASKVLDTALENGANFIQRMVAFRHDDAQIKRDGLTKAVEDALANARAIAAGAKVQVSGTFALNGQPEYTFGQGQCGLTNTLVVGGAGLGATPVIVGDLEITIRVGVTCTY